MKKIPTKNKIDFIGMTAHQLRTPLTLMKGYMSMILNGDYGKINEPELKSALNNVYQANEELVSLVENLLTKSRLDNHDLKINHESVDIKKIITKVISDIKPKADAKNLKLIFIKNSVSGKLLGDGVLLRQVFINLIDNAIIYTKHGKITINLKRNKKTVLVKVTDTGIGLTARKLQMLFNKFERPNFGSSHEGFGLGLYIAGLIIKAHEGKITARVNKPKGLEVSCELPV